MSRPSRPTIQTEHNRRTPLPQLMNSQQPECATADSERASSSLEGGSNERRRRDMSKHPSEEKLEYRPSSSILTANTSSEDHPVSDSDPDQSPAIEPEPIPFYSFSSDLGWSSTGHISPLDTPSNGAPSTSPTWGYAADNRESLAQSYRAIANTIRLASLYSDSYKRMIQPP